MLAGRLSESNFPPLEGIQKGKLSHPIDKNFLILIFFDEPPLIVSLKTYLFPPLSMIKHPTSSSHSL
jgi:hypothetical protein